MTDYLIVGSGLAGIAFAETALQHSKTVMVYDDESHHSSWVAAGLYNPVILKRFSKLMNAQQQLHDLTSFYQKVEARLNVKVNYPLPTLRKFFSIEEQNNWFQAADKPGLAEFLSTDIIHKHYSGIDAPLGYGEVMQTGYVDTAMLLTTYRQSLKHQDLFVNDTFEYDALSVFDNHIDYKNTSARHIVFAEGFGIHANPYFNYLPLDGTKGELFVIRAPNLNLDVILNTAIFILPIGNDLFKVGATYNWSDKSDTPTEEGRIELIQKISEILNCEFEIVEHLAGVRPTVKDRKPLLGTHPEFDNIHILNGLGTRGVMLGPYMANELYEHIENQKPIDRENNIDRFKPSYRGVDRNS